MKRSFIFITQEEKYTKHFKTRWGITIKIDLSVVYLQNIFTNATYNNSTFSLEAILHYSASYPFNFGDKKMAIGIKKIITNINKNVDTEK